MADREKKFETKRKCGLGERQFRNSAFRNPHSQFPDLQFRNPHFAIRISQFPDLQFRNPHFAIRISQFPNSPTVVIRFPGAKGCGTFV
jgi:hypothetical protein